LWILVDFGVALVGSGEFWCFLVRSAGLWYVLAGSTGFLAGSCRFWCAHQVQSARLLCVLVIFGVDFWVLVCSGRF
jgi:hypothetical protein